MHAKTPKRSLLRRIGAAALIVGLTTIGTVSPSWAADGITAEVWGTGGQTLFVRSAPNTGSATVAQLREGTQVEIECQVDAESVDGNAVWNYLPAHDGYAADRYLNTGHDGRHPELPDCDPPDQQPAEPGAEIRDRIVELAKGELGNTDKSKYGAPPDHDWCQYFVNWVWSRAGVQDMNDTHFTGDFYHWGKRRGLARDGTDGIKVGDAVLFGGPTQQDKNRHVGIVVETHDDGTITTIDGNYDNAVTKVGPFDPDNVQPHYVRDVYAVVSPPAPARTPSEPADPPADLVVNGHRLTATEAANVRWIATKTLPRIGGDVDAAAMVTWWALKEGVLGKTNPHAFSHCDGQPTGAVDPCAAECCWQVGIAAAQQPNFGAARTAEVAKRLYPGWSVDRILAHTAGYSGFGRGTPEYAKIVGSTGSLRNSWLLRNHGVGFVLQAEAVEAECVRGSLAWCYGTAWDTTAKYAPDKAASRRAIEDLRAILTGLG